MRQRKDNKVSEEVGHLQYINHKYAWLYSDLKIFKLLFKLKQMVIWVTHNTPWQRHHKSPFTSNLLSMWNAKLKNIHENKRSRRSIYKNPSIATTTTTKTTPTAPIVSTRDHFSLLTGKLNPLHDIIDYDCYHVLKFNRDSYLYDDLVIYIHGVWTEQTSAKNK